MRYFLIFLFIIFGVCTFRAQTIELTFPAFAGKTYEFIIFQGDKSIRLYENDTIPKNGVLKLEIPKEYAPYTGMCRWLITNSPEGGGLDMAIPGHGFKVSCFSDKPNENNIKWDGYDAMNELNRLHTIQQLIIDKFDAMSKASMLYGTRHHLPSIFQKEKNIQQEAFIKFQDDLKHNTNYNARFLPIVNLVQGIPPQLTDDYEKRARLVDEYITSELNYDHLYTSGYWTGIIQSWVQMHSQMLKNKEIFTNHFITIGKRIPDPKKYTDFVGRVTYYLTQYGKDDFIESIATTVLSSDKITSYEEKTMQVYIQARIGSKAPDLIITEHIGNKDDHNHKTTVIKSEDFAQLPYTKTLLVFYESGCGPCEVLMQQLPGNYEFLNKKGVKIIAISSDQNEQRFKNTSYNFPWKDTYCDYEGKQGINFKNYAVQGTPTIFLIDSAGIIKSKMASMG